MAGNISSEYRENDEQREFRRSISGMLEREWGEEALRSAFDGDSADLQGVKLKIHGSLAIGGLLVPEEYGGLGGTRVDATVASEELGAGLAPYDILGSSMSANVLLAATGSERDSLLGRIAEDERPVVFLWPGSDASWSVSAIEPAVVDGATVTAHFSYVPGLDEGSLLVMPAKRGDEIGVAVVDGAAAADQVSFTSVVSADALRTVGHVSIQGAECTFLPVPDAEAVYSATLSLGAILLAAEMVGAARTCIERTVEYGLARRQFGHPIVTFQALKHGVVDAVVELERARASTYRAATRADVGDVDTSADEAIMLARIAKASAGAALRAAARQSIQVHGAMGFTWENLSHRYLKKWTTGNDVYGSSDAQRGLIYSYSQYGNWGAVPVGA
jgi:alkylation response protein AidB-like acyl-CoA dehydrogenase